MQPKQTRIDVLPVEILSLIFKAVYCAVSHTPVQDVAPYSHLDIDLWALDDLMEPAVFPYNLASVCTHWQDIMSTVPIFWTRLLVFVDLSPSSPSQFRSHLELSRNHPIDVHILRRDREEVMSDPHEGARVRTIMDILRPHLHRCMSLSLEVIHNSSLPSFSDDICGIPDLQSLKLDCRVGDEGSHIRAASGVNKRPTFNQLESLYLDGPNFIDACKRFPGWVEFLPHYEPFTALAISNLTHSAGKKANFSLYDVFATLEDVPHIILDNVEFPYEPESHAVGSISFRPPFLELHNLSEGFVRELFTVADTYIDNLEIFNCPLAAIEQPFVAEVLALSDIDDSSTLANCIRLWDGKELVLSTCTGFDDRFLDKMNEGELMPDNSMDHCLRFVERLHLSSCSNFSLDALKRMIVAQSVGFESSPLSLYLEHCGLSLSEDDVSWLNANLKSLHFN